MRRCSAIFILAFLLLVPMVTFGSPGELLSATPAITMTNSTVLLPVRDDSDEDSVYYTYGFEDDWNGWTHEDLTNPGDLWHLYAGDWAFEGNSWWCSKEELGGYDNHWLQYLVTPTFDFSDVGDGDIILTFKVAWVVEDPAGTIDPWDGWDGSNLWISTDGGEEWEVIEPAFPEYTNRSLYSFGEEWNMGEDIPGWCGTSEDDGSWVDAQFDLSDYNGREEVKIRWAFCSDPMWCTIDDADAFGIMVDDIVISVGEEVFFSNNGDDDGDDNEMEFDTGPSAGDPWEISDEASNSGDYSAHCEIGRNLQAVLISPGLEIPEDPWYTYFEYYVWADQLNTDPNDDGSLDDYFTCDYSEDGIVWEKLHHDYGRDQEWWDGFHYYGPDVTYNDLPDWKRKLNLTRFGGQTIFLRWKAISDDVVGDNEGSGLWIDDFSLMITQRREIDAGIEWLQVNYPNSLDLETNCYMSVKNFGMLDIGNIRRFSRINDGSNVPALPWQGLESDSSMVYNFKLNNVDFTRFQFADVIDLTGIVSVNDDSNAENDEYVAENIVIYPEGIWVLGYDNHSYERAFDLGEDNGPATLYTPEDDGISEAFDLKAVRTMWNGVGEDVEAMLHIKQDDDGVPGDDIFSTEITVTQATSWPEFWSIDLTGEDPLQEMNHRDNFWIWFEITSEDGLPQITGDVEIIDRAHHFSYDETTLNEVNGEFFIHPVLMPAGYEATILIAGRDEMDFGESQVRRTNRMTLALYNGGTNEVTIENLTIDNDSFRDSPADFQDYPYTLGIGEHAQIYIDL